LLSRSVPFSPVAIRVAIPSVAITMECTAICFRAATTVPSWRASSRLTPGARPRTHTPTRGGSQAPPFAEERITELKERLEHAREQKQTAEHGSHRSLRSPSSSATPSAGDKVVRQPIVHRPAHLLRLVRVLVVGRITPKRRCDGLLELR